MKTVEVNLERQALITICDGDNLTRKTLLSKLREDHFGYEPNANIFKRIQSLVENGKSVPSSDQLKADIALGEDAKIMLKGKVKRLKKKDVNSLIEKLNDYRKARKLSKTMIKAAASLEGDGPKDLDEVARVIARDIASVQVSNDIKISTQINCKKNFDRILYGELSLVPTGFDAFDQENGGFPNGQVVILAASTGGGKSCVALNLAINQYRAGYSPMIWSMEMDADEIWQRLASNLTGIPHSKFMLKELTNKQKERAHEQIEKFKTIGKEKDCDFSIISPERDYRFEEIAHYFRLKKKQIDILYIDYISLIKPEDHRLPQHERLGEITRSAKKLAKELNIPIVLLSQINKDDEIKYSGAINENSGLTIIWRYDDQAKETHEINMTVDKARNQNKIKFVLRENFDCMRIENLQDTVKPRRKKLRKSKKELSPEDDL